MIFAGAYIAGVFTENLMFSELFKKIYHTKHDEDDNHGNGKKRGKASKYVSAHHKLYDDEGEEVEDLSTKTGGKIKEISRKKLVKEIFTRG